MALDDRRTRLRPAKDGNGFGNGLREEHQPRPWKCTRFEAIYCPLHGDCICRGGKRREDCRLHGDESEHAQPDDEYCRRCGGMFTLTGIGKHRCIDDD